LSGCPAYPPLMMAVDAFPVLFTFVVSALVT
jgi:hypothetical protein